MDTATSSPSQSGSVVELRRNGIRCRGLKRIDKGALVGFVDLQIIGWHLVLHDCKWFRKGPQEWIGLPSSSFTNREGKTVYKDLVEFDDKQAAERFQSAALDAVHTFRSTA